MKNFPHPLNDLNKLFQALKIAKVDFADQNAPLTDSAYGEQLLRQGVRNYRDRRLTLDQYLVDQRRKRPQDRSYETTPRDLKFFFKLLGFIVIGDGDAITLTPQGLELINEDSEERRLLIWKNAFLQLALEGADGEIVHPYRILLKLVNSFPGIPTAKLMLALEAENNSDEEFARISALVPLSVEDIIESVNTSQSMADNAVKILPGIAEQLGDIDRSDNRAYPIGEVVITEDEISTEESDNAIPGRVRSAFRETSANEIARDPQLNVIVNTTVDIAAAVRQRQQRLAEHQEIVRQLASFNAARGFSLFEGKFDCLSRKNQRNLLFEVKTLSATNSDEEKQTVKGVGQLKFYDFSIVRAQMGQNNVQQLIVYSRRPSNGIIAFCSSENIGVMWRNGATFQIFDSSTQTAAEYDPDLLIA